MQGKGSTVKFIVNDHVVPLRAPDEPLVPYIVSFSMVGNRTGIRAKSLPSGRSAAELAGQLVAWAKLCRVIGEASMPDDPLFTA